MASTGAGSGTGNPLSIIKFGESLDFVFDRGGESVDGWVCQLLVKRFTTSTALVDRTIPLDSNNQWSGFLTSAETLGLTTRGIYRMIGVLTNASTDEKETIPVRFQISKPWIAPADLTVGFPFYLTDNTIDPSASSFATKANYEIAATDFIATHQRFWPTSQAGSVGEMFIALVDGSQVITEILSQQAYPALIEDQWNEIELITPAEISSGAGFVQGIVRTDSVGTADPGIAETTDPYISGVSFFQNGWRREDNAINVGDGNDSTNVEPWLVEYRGTRSTTTPIVPFDPLDLITGPGWYYEMLAANVFQDAALTIPVTADGQRTLGLADLTTNGLNGTQPSVGKGGFWRPATNSIDFEGSLSEEHFMTDLLPSNTAFTYAARVQVDLASSGFECIEGSSFGILRAYLLVNDGVLGIGVGSDSVADSTATDLRSATEFHVVVGCWDLTNIKLYLDGVEVLSFTRTAGTANSTIPIALGARNTSATQSSEDLPFDGNISHALAMQRKITPTEVAELTAAWTA